MNTVSDGDLEVVSAFVDRETVDSASLTAILATAEGREYLIDLLRIRQAVTGLSLQAERPRSVRTARFQPVVTWSIPAVLIGAFVAGYFVRAGLEPARRPDNRNVVLVEPTQALVEASAPAPSVVIDLQPGVSWFEGTQVR